MPKSRYDNIVIVTRMTELEELVARFNTVAQARFYLEHAQQSFAPVQAAHDAQIEALNAVRAALGKGQKHQFVDRSLVPQFSFQEDDLVVAIGQDGLVSNTAKYLHGQPVLGVNPDPRRFDGVLLPFDGRTIARGLALCQSGEATLANVSLAEVRLNDGQRLLAFNDFFIGARSHVSARYELAVGDREETQSSSGIVISTGAGSTGWMQSMYAGARGIIEALGGQVTPAADGGRLPWDSQRLLYCVREPFPSVATGTSLVYGSFTNRAPLTVTSRMGANGVIFSDGVEADYLEFNTGSTAVVTVAGKTARLVLAD